MSPVFLGVEAVLAIHREQLKRFGGGQGFLNEAHFHSALAQPRAMFQGRYLHPTLAAMAAAYLFYLVSNHAFVDGNKRTGLLAALNFLALNGIEVEGHSDELYELTMGVADGTTSRAAVVAFFEGITGGA